MDRTSGKPNGSHTMNISDGIHGSSMEEKQFLQHQVLTEFLEKLPTTTGWWYRLPILNSSETNSTLDLFLPHFGTLFGLTEDAIAVVLLEMGLLKSSQKNGAKMVTNIVRGAWDDLISVFKVKNCIEVSTTRLRGIQGRWYM